MGLRRLLKMSPPLRIAYLLKRFSLLKSLNIQLKAEFAGQNYTIPLLNSIGYRNLVFNTEPWMKELITKILKRKNGAFLDIGANIGQTLMKLRSVSTVPYIGFEPNPESVVYLERLIKANNLPACTVCPVGLSNQNRLLTLYTSFAGSPYATVIKGYNAHHKVNKTRVVAVFRGDDIIPTVLPGKEIAIVKIDVEGAELEVIEGLQTVLRVFRPYVIIEIVPVKRPDEPDKESRQQRIDRLLALVEGFNYLIFDIDETRNTYEPVLQLEMGKDGSDNYVFVPAESEDEFVSNAGSHALANTANPAAGLQGNPSGS